MKKQNIKKETILNWLIAIFVFCMTGGLMQMIAPEFPNHAAFIGLVFFAAAAVLGVVIWRLRIAVREERTAAAREQARRARRHQAN